jgi:hypothetical protein
VEAFFDNAVQQDILQTNLCEKEYSPVDKARIKINPGGTPSE